MNLKKLNNGITVINVHKTESLTTIVRFIISAGAKHEDDSNRGVAHFLEHMIFKGTSSRSAKEISTYVSSFGMDINASTGYDDTLYSIDCLPEDVPVAFEVLSDMLQNSLFEKKELKKERGAILEEKRIYLQEESEVDMANFEKTMFADKYINSQIIGSIKDIKKINRETLVDFYNAFYNTNNLTVITVGNVSLDETVSYTLKYLDKLPAGSQSISFPQVYKGGSFKGAKYIKSNKIKLGFLIPNDVEAYVAELLSIIIARDPSSRLFFRLREDLGLVYAISSKVEIDLPSVFSIIAKASSENVNRVIEETCSEISLIQHEFVQAEELQKAKKIYLINISKLFENNEDVVEIVYNNYLINGELFDLDLRRKQIEKVSIDDIIYAAKRIFSTNPTYFVSGKVDNLLSYSKFCELLKNYVQL